MKKNTFNILIIIFVSFGALLWLNHTNKLSEVIYIIKNANIFYIVIAMSFMFLYWLLEGKILKKILEYINIKFKFRDSFKVSMIGQFFNAITPFASGGQPAQLYYLSKKGVKAGSGASALMIKFIIYQGVLTIYSLILMIFRSKYFKSRMNNLFYLSTIGFSINTLVIIVLLLFSISSDLTKNTFKFLGDILIKLRVIKNKEDIKNNLENNLKIFHKNMLVLKQYKKLIFDGSILTTMQLTSYFIIPYFIYRAFGLKGENILNIIAANAFVLMLTSFIPLPGAAGGAEGGFYMFFKLFFSKETIIVAIILWRIVTFYSSIFLGGIITIFNINKNLSNK